MSDWIKCSERMPGRLEKVLGVSGPLPLDDFQIGFDGKPLRSVDTVYIDQSGLWRLWKGPHRFGFYVTHWQPLPEPPT